uniref:Myocyte enhancer factor 2D n=1 Tax=Cyanoderma ruficeps TaxID=181631 RepID=A0A8C3QHX9_9PASS
MGRKKIQIQRITDERNRQVTFTKRKFGLMKKAYELSVLCDCEIALIIFNHSNKLFQYASTDMDKVLLKYTEYNEPHESRTNADIIETLRKKGFNGCDSPEPDGDDSIDQSPLMEDKYRKGSEDLDILFKRYGVSTCPWLENLHYMFFSVLFLFCSTSPQPRPLAPPRHPRQPALQRNTVSPGLPQRPASAGAMLGGDLNNTNGACPSPVGNGYVSARASPGLLPVSNGSSLGKIIPAKSPPPPSHSTQLAANSRKPDLRVITSQSGKGLMHHLTEDHLALQNTQRLGVSQATHSLTTPVVSVRTTQLTSAELSSLPAFSSPGGLSLGNISAWQQQQQQQQQNRRSPVSPQLQHQHQAAAAAAAFLQQRNSYNHHQVPGGGRGVEQGSHLSHTTTLTVNTNPNISIKSEPVSPNRERNTATPLSTFPHQPRHEPTGRSPVDSLSSNTSSYEGSSERDDPARPDFGSSLGLLRPTSEPEGESPSVKRMRLDTWVT